MKKRATRLLAILTICLCGAMLAPILAAAPAYAAAKPQGLSPDVYKDLKDAQDLMKEGHLDDALAKAQAAQQVEKRTPFDDFKIDEVLAIIYIQKQDYANAATNYEAAYQTKLWDPKEQGMRLSTLAKLFFQIKQYDKSIGYCNDYTSQVGDGNLDEYLDVQAILANAYLEQKDSQKAFDTAKALVAKAQSTNTPMKQAWWQLLLYSASDLNNDDAKKQALFGLVTDFPTPEAWHDFAGTLYNEAGHHVHTGLLAMRLMYAADGMKQPQDYLALAQLALGEGLPGEAKNVIDTGVSKGVLPGDMKALYTTLKKQADDSAKSEQAGLDAKDKKSAAEKSAGGDIAIGEAYATYGETDKAVAAIKRGLALGTLSNPDDGRASLGWAYFVGGQMDDAKTAFESVKTDPNLLDIAHGWLVLIKQKTSPAPAAPMAPAADSTSQ